MQVLGEAAGRGEVVGMKVWEGAGWWDVGIETETGRSLDCTIFTEGNSNLGGQG